MLAVLQATTYFVILCATVEAIIWVQRQMVYVGVADGCLYLS